MNLWKQALCSRESKHKTLELWWLMLTLLQQLFPNVFHSCVVPTPSARGALERRWKQSRVYWFHTRCLEYQHQTDQPGCRQATLRPTAWLPRAKISTVDFSFTKPWDRNTARVQPVKKDIQKNISRKSQGSEVCEVSDSVSWGSQGLVREGLLPSPCGTAAKRCREVSDIPWQSRQFARISHQSRCNEDVLVKELWKTSKRTEDSRRQVQSDTIRYRTVARGRDEPLCCLGLTVQCI